MTDIFSMGVLSYELLTGTHPFATEGENRDDKELMRAIATAPPPPIPAGIPENLGCLVNDMLNKDPRRRPRARQVHKRLAGALTGESSAQLRSRAMTLLDGKEYSQAIQLFERAFERTPSGSDGGMALDFIIDTASRHNKFEVYRKYLVDHLDRHGRPDALDALVQHQAFFPELKTTDLLEFAEELLGEVSYRLRENRDMQVKVIEAVRTIKVPDEMLLRKLECVVDAYEDVDAIADAAYYLHAEAERLRAERDAPLRLRLLGRAWALAQYSADPDLKIIVSEELEDIRNRLKQEATARDVPPEERDSVERVVKRGEEGHTNKPALERFVQKLYHTFSFVQGARAGEWFNGNGKRRVRELTEDHLKDCIISVQLDGASFLRAGARNLEFQIKLHPESQPAEVRAAHAELVDHRLFQ